MPSSIVSRVPPVIVVSVAVVLARAKEVSRWIHGEGGRATANKPPTALYGLPSRVGRRRVVCCTRLVFCCRSRYTYIHVAARATEREFGWLGVGRERKGTQVEKNARTFVAAFFA